ncbi:metallophosphoesterase family protein [Fuchsiella alkaliacetigena]|uniref:metallophosphoesterase family protein n=1 Tax=Fuchsiella alkaliacetigena TaxID=957042 RepID=UPI00200AEF5C|nr:metallophosphoesterase [Fuchsiella alkaliacetigena]MCK8824261.1 metallophosphoesterase [Fuchsiella alkaliacetigena]
MKLLVLTDTHIRGTTPRNRIDDFPATLKKKLLEIRDLIESEEIDYVLHGGDLFDRPDTAPAVVGDFVEVLRSFTAPIYVVAGNHDLYGHNPNTLPRTMLGLLATTGVVEILAPGEDRIIEQGGVKLQLTGTAFHSELDRGERVTEYLVEKEAGVDYLINIVHGMLLPSPFEAGEVDYTLIEALEATEAELTITGHYHSGFGLKKLNEETYCLNPGSLVRIGAYSSELERRPQVAIVELKSTEMEVNLHELEVAAVGPEVLDRSEIELSKYREKKLANFTQEIKGAGEFEFLELDTILAELAENQDLKDEIKQEARERIARAEERLT